MHLFPMQIRTIRSAIRSASGAPSRRISSRIQIPVAPTPHRPFGRCSQSSDHLVRKKGHGFGVPDGLFRKSSDHLVRDLETHLTFVCLGDFGGEPGVPH